jgi:hypothetical protein
MSGGQQGDLPAHVSGLEGGRLPELENVLKTFPTEPSLHESRGGLSQDDFAVFAHVVAVRVADEYSINVRLRLVRIKPELQRRQVNAAAVKLKRQDRHKFIVMAAG